MSETHTPRPWEVIADPVLMIVGNDGSVIAEVTALETPQHGDEFANARLIAAAPDLLEAAQKVLAELNRRIDQARLTAVPVFDGIVDLHDAIARATQAPQAETEGGR